MKKLVIFSMGVCLIVGTTFGAVYKWTDKDGDIHYSDNPPEQKKAQEIEIKPSPPPPKSKFLESIQESKPQELLQESETQNLLRHSFNGRSATLKELGSLPKNNVSKYLTTKSSSLAITDLEKRVAKFSILLKAKRALPSRAYLEAHFDNPADPNSPLIVWKVRKRGQQEIFFMSPEFKGLKCWNYHVAIYIYRGRSNSHLLGVHRQVIQSRLNLDKVKSLNHFLEVGKHGICP